MNCVRYRLELPGMRYFCQIIMCQFAFSITCSLEASELNSDLENRIAKSIAGSWTVVDKMQGVFDGLSSGRKTQGERIEKFQVKLVDMKEFWRIRQVRQVEGKLRKHADDINHEIIATGLFQVTMGDRPLGGFDGFFLLTQNNGETFLCVLNIDGATFMPWPIHYIQGRQRSEDILIVEFHFNARQIAILQYSGELATKPSATNDKSTNWNGRFEYRNNGNELIQVNRVTNFKGHVSCGNLSPGSTAGINSGLTDLVEEFAVEWRELGKMYTRQLSLKDIPLSKRKGSLIIEYEGAEKWQAYFEEAAY